MQTYLITGGAGFIGSHFVKLVRQKSSDTRIIILDALTYAGDTRNLEGIIGTSGVTFIHGNVTDEITVERVFAEFTPHVVINFAAETHVDRSVHGQPVDFVMTNVRGTQVLLDAARRHPVRRFMQVSTDEVYGALSLESHERFTENSPLVPNSPYAASKAAADLLCRSYQASYNIPVIITRCSNNYGTNQFPEKMIPFWITELLNGRKIPMYGDGLYVRDWIHVIDHVRAIWAIIEKGENGSIYNISVGNEYSNMDIANIILDEMGLTREHIRVVTDRPGHDRRYALDAGKLFRELHFTAEYPRSRFRDEIREVINWYKNNSAWIKELEEKHGKFNPHIPPEPKAKLFIFGNGLLGSAYHKYFESKNYTVVNESIDVRDANAVYSVLQKEKPDIVLNCVAKTDIDWCELNKNETIAVNTVGADNIGAACASLNLYFVHISSGCVQESSSSLQTWKETDPVSPVCFYSWTKVFADTLLEYRAKRDGLKTLILRPRQLLSSVLSSRNALAKMLTYTKFIDTDNSCTVVDDLLKVTEMLIERKAEGIFNVVNPGVTSPLKIALTLKNIIKPDMVIEKITKEELNSMTYAQRIDSVLSTEKLEREGIHLQNIDARLLHVIAELKKNIESEQGRAMLMEVQKQTSDKLSLKTQKN